MQNICIYIYSGFLFSQPFGCPCDSRSFVDKSQESRTNSQAAAVSMKTHRQGLATDFAFFETVAYVHCLQSHICRPTWENHAPMGKHHFSTEAFSSNQCLRLQTSYALILSSYSRMRQHSTSRKACTSSISRYLLEVHKG